MLYKKVVRPILFRIDPEHVHDLAVSLLSVVGKCSIISNMVSRFLTIDSLLLKQTVDGIHYAVPVGLPAGFDKNGQLTKSMHMFGYGFMEVGSVTARSCKGNVKPRLWRIPAFETLVVHYGLKNDGCDTVADRIRATATIPIGANIAQTNDGVETSIEEAINDYYSSYVRLEPFANYMVINISCPNAVYGQQFLIAKNLDLLLTKLDTIVSVKPRYLKLSPDLPFERVDDILAIVREHRIDGFIISNLVKDRNLVSIPQNFFEKVGEGGLSGSVTRDLSTALISYVFEKTQGQYTIIGCGGIMNSEHAYQKLKAGASLVQVLTGFIYGGPMAIYRINRGVKKLMERDGIKTIKDLHSGQFVHNEVNKKK